MRARRVQALDAAAIIITVVALVVGGYLVLRTPRGLGESTPAQPVTPAPGQQTVSVLIDADSSAATIGQKLEELGVIRSGRQFELLVRLMGLESQLSAGEHVLPLGLSAVAAIRAVTVQEDVPTIRVTFPEGLRIEEMAVIAENAGFGTSQQFLDAVAAARLPAEWDEALPEGANLQGYLFPDTYILPVGAGPAALVDLMLRTFVERFSPALRQAVRDRGLTLHQALTLASIVEREAVIEDERPLIAGVFYNRINAADLIGADPTVQFALALNPDSVRDFGWWKKELTLEDLAVDSPYNTRLYPGIPPGPIANPGLASIEAVANPTVTALYYFVADAKKGDGSHVFAETLEEHERNVAEVGTP